MSELDPAAGRVPRTARGLARAGRPTGSRLVVLTVLLAAAGVGMVAVVAKQTPPQAVRSCSETCAPQLTPVPGGQLGLAVTQRRPQPGADAAALGRVVQR